MRTEILNYVQSLNLGTVTVSTELPWVDNDIPLYRKNLKKIYVDIDNVTTDPIVQALNGFTLSNETTSIRLYFACDAKVLIPNYSDILDQLKTARNVAAITAVQRRECDVTTTMENDLLVTEFEYRFIKILK